MTYLYNQTFKTALRWKSFYETFHIYVWWKEIITNFQKSQFHHFWAYECKCYVLIKFQNDFHKANKFWKPNSHVHIEFFIEYVFINVYHIWISHKQKIIFVQNVIFDEQQMWNEKTIKYIIKNIKQFNETIFIIKILYINEIKNQQLDEDDLKDITKTPTQNPAILTKTDETDVTAENNIIKIANEEDKQTKQNKLNWMANQYSNSDSFIIEAMLVQFIFITFNATSHSEEVIIETEKMKLMKNVFIESVILNELKKRQFNRFYNFKSRWVFSKMQKTFTANFKYIFFFEFKHYKDFKDHPYKKNFQNSMKQQIKQHRQDFNFWTAVDRWESNEHQVLSCQWVFKYKTGKHGELLKCKARIVVCDNQQHWSKLLIRAITLIIVVLRILLALFVKFNLEILQLDAVNVFVYVFLNEIVFMRMFFEYEKQKKILWMNKTFYDFKQSFFLWQRKFMNVLWKLEFIEIFQKSCIIVRREIIIFFVDDCVIVFFKNKRDEMMTTMNKLVKKFIINIINEFKWFLKMHIIRNHSIKCLWLFQKTYIKKICKNLMKSSINHPPFTFMNTAELLFAKNDEKISDESKILYQ